MNTTQSILWDIVLRAYLVIGGHESVAGVVFYPLQVRALYSIGHECPFLAVLEHDYTYIQEGRFSN